MFGLILFTQVVFQILSDILLGLARQAPDENAALVSAIPGILVSCHLLFDMYGITLGVFLLLQAFTLRSHIMNWSAEQARKVNTLRETGTRTPIKESSLKVFIPPLLAVVSLHFTYRMLFAYISLNRHVGDVKFFSIKNVKNLVELCSLSSTCCLRSR